MLKKVLAVEDREHTQTYWEDMLSGKVELIFASSIQEAEEKFVANPDIVAIVMDACVPGAMPNTMPLVEKFRAKFTGPMIATSNDDTFCEELVQAGCNHKCGKNSVPQKLCEILGLQV